MQSMVIKSKLTRGWGLVELRQEGEYYCIYVDNCYKQSSKELNDMIREYDSYK